MKFVGKVRVRIVKNVSMELMRLNSVTVITRKQTLSSLSTGVILLALLISLLSSYGTTSSTIAFPESNSTKQLPIHAGNITSQKLHPLLLQALKSAALKTQGSHQQISLESKKQVVVAEVPESRSAQKRASFTFPYVYPSSPTAPGTTSQPNNCICVPLYLCVDNQLIIDIGQLDLRHGWGWGWPCGSKQFTCCPIQSTPPPPTTAPPPQTTALPGYTPRCGSLNPNGINARILGIKDSETQFGEYPWMAAVLDSKSGNKNAYKFLCGGALIWPTVIITAAHCVYGKTEDNLVIRLGEWDTQSVNEFYPHQDILVDEIVIHPQFYAGGLYFDVAMIFLSSSAILAPHIDTICLPEILPNYENTSCWATGWGKNSFGKPDSSYQVILKEVELSVTARPACESALRGTNLGSKFNLHSSFLCAGGQNSLDTCVGDGGGGLVCPSSTDPWRYVLSGIVSWGVGCGEKGVPGVYVDVTRVRTWIDLTISARIPSYDISRVTVTNDLSRLG